MNTFVRLYTELFTPQAVSLSFTQQKTPHAFVC